MISEPDAVVMFNTISVVIGLPIPSTRVPEIVTFLPTYASLGYASISMTASCLRVCIGIMLRALSSIPVLLMYLLSPR